MGKEEEGEGRESRREAKGMEELTSTRVPRAGVDATGSAHDVSGDWASELGGCGEKESREMPKESGIPLRIMAAKAEDRISATKGRRIMATKGEG